MGYTANASVADLFDAGPMDRALTRIAERAGEELRKRVTRGTPVARKPPGVDRATWIAARGGRAPGTAKASWRTGDVEVTAGDGRRIEVYSLDLRMEHIEWDTTPHLIRVRRARALRWWSSSGAIRFAEQVQHPGTTGVHMMRDSLAEVQATVLIRVGAIEMRRWAAEQRRLVA